MNQRLKTELENHYSKAWVQGIVCTTIQALSNYVRNQAGLSQAQDDKISEVIVILEKLNKDLGNEIVDFRQQMTRK